MIAAQDLDSPAAAALAARVEAMAFNPWHGVEDHRPLGSMMRGRREAYRTSHAHRTGSAVEPTE